MAAKLTTQKLLQLAESVVTQGLNSLALAKQPEALHNIANKTGLGSAQARPANFIAYGLDTTKPADYPNLEARLAAELSYGIIMNHVFQDGNKRTAFLAANQYLRVMGHKAFVEADPENIDIDTAIKTIGDAHEKLAEKKIDVEGLAKVYAKQLK